jgi:hypothetical protein
MSDEQKKIKDLEEENERLRKARESSMWDRFTGFFSGFGFFEMILVALVVGGLWLAAKANPEFTQSLVEKLPESWQPTVLGALGSMGIDVDMTATVTAMAKKDLPELQKTLLEKGMPEGVVKIVAANEKSLSDFIAIVREANKTEAKGAVPAKLGAFNTATMTNDKTIFELLTKHAPLAQALTAAAFTGKAAASDTSKNILTSLKAITGDERLDTLLSDTHRKTTVALLGKFVPQASETQINALLTAGIENGKAKPELRAFLAKALTADAEGKLPDAAPLLAELAKNPAIATVLATPSQPTTPTAAPTAGNQTLLQQLQANNGGKAYAALRDTMKDDQKLITTLAILGGADELAKIKVGIENRKAFEAYLAKADATTLPKEILESLQTLKATPVAAQKPILALLEKGVNPRELKSVFIENGRPFTTQHMVAQLFDPKNRETIAKAGVENVVALVRAVEPTAASSLTPASLTAMLKATHGISSNPKMADKNVARDATHVTAALTDIVLKNDASALNKLSKETFTQFIGDAANMEALKTLLGDVKNESPKAAALAQHWRVIEILASDKEKGAEFLREQLTSISSKPPMAMCTKPKTELDWTDQAQLAVAGRDVLKLGSKNIIGRNAEEIKALGLALENATCTEAAQQTNLAATSAGSPIRR